MARPSEIPASVREDISIYLEPEEQIAKAICSVSGKIKATGEVWLLLTNRSIFFHTREYKKDPVVALMRLKDIKEIDYFQKSNELILTFVLKNKPDNFTRLTFPISKKAELEDFCEDIADLINFRLETAQGVQVFPRPEQNTSEPDKKDSEPVKKTVSDSNTVSDRKPSSYSNHFGRRPAQPEVKIVSAKSSGSGGFSLKYALIATLISIIIGFIWFQFFKTIAGFKNRQ